MIFLDLPHIFSAQPCFDPHQGMARQILSWLAEHRNLPPEALLQLGLQSILEGGVRLRFQEDLEGFISFEIFCQSWRQNPGFSMWDRSSKSLQCCPDGHFALCFAGCGLFLRSSKIETAESIQKESFWHPSCVLEFLMPTKSCQTMEVQRFVGRTLFQVHRHRGLEQLGGTCVLPMAGCVSDSELNHSWDVFSALGFNQSCKLGKLGLSINNAKNYCLKFRDLWSNYRNNIGTTSKTMQNSWRFWCFEDGDCSASVLSEKLRACLQHVVVGVLAIDWGLCSYGFESEVWNLMVWIGKANPEMMNSGDSDIPYFSWHNCHHGKGVNSSLTCHRSEFFFGS